MGFRGNTKTENTTPTSGLRKQFIACFIAMLLFTLIYLVLGPWLKDQIGEERSNVFYMVSRLIGFLGLGIVLKGWALRNRIQTLTSIGFVGFFDQVLLKWVFLRGDIHSHPELWKDIPMAQDPVNLFFGLTQGFLYFIPILLILGFFGTELARFVFRPKPEVLL